MSWSFYFNMEKLALNIAKSHINNMTNDNYCEDDDVFLDGEKLSINLENGFVALTQLSCYFESFLNTIINSCMHYEGEALLKCNHEEKMDIIFMHYGKDYKAIKAKHCWQLYSTAKQVRNEMIHFKNTYIGDGSSIPNFKIGKVYVAEYFTKNSITETYNGYISLCKEIAQAVGLKIFDTIDVFECDGRDGLTNYVYDETDIDIDETRFE